MKLRKAIVENKRHVFVFLRIVTNAKQPGSCAQQEKKKDIAKQKGQLGEEPPLSVTK
jgi:hypothetical protein